MVLRLDPRFPLVWRSATAMQVGLDHPRVVLEGVGYAEELLVHALRVGTSAGTARLIATRAGASYARVDELLATLRPVLLRSIDPDPPAPPRVVVEGVGSAADALRSLLRGEGCELVGDDAVPGAGDTDGGQALAHHPDRVRIVDEDFNGRCARNAIIGSVDLLVGRQRFQRPHAGLQHLVHQLEIILSRFERHIHEVRIELDHAQIEDGIDRIGSYLRRRAERHHRAFGIDDLHLVADADTQRLRQAVADSHAPAVIPLIEPALLRPIIEQRQLLEVLLIHATHGDAG